MERNTDMTWLRDWWNRRRRRIDLEILWPACRSQARDLDHARAAFAVHALHDDAWLCLGEEEVCRQIDRLE
jgi:hypothetical protein